MKLIHMSDLHFGKRLHEQSLLEDQRYIAGEILELISREKPDAVLIAGDIYDKSVPSAEAVDFFDDFLYKLSLCGAAVYIISGNHDSPERLAFGSRLMVAKGVHLARGYNENVCPHVLTDEHGELAIYLLPFIKPGVVRAAFPDAEISSYTEAVALAIEHMRPDPGRRNVLVAHQFVTGASVCDSEELSVGGLDNVDASVFDAFDYVALGHLHGPQNMGSERIRYCGSPLKYSFSEAKHQKSLTVVELGEKGKLTLRLLPLSPLRDMRELRGSFAELTDPAVYSCTDCKDYIRITLTDEEDVPEAHSRLRQIYPNLLRLDYDNTRTRAQSIVSGAEEVRRKAPIELFEELFTDQNGTGFSDAQRDFVSKLIEELREESA